MTCSPEAVIWNALLLEWGMTLLQVEMHDAWLQSQQACEAGGSDTRSMFPRADMPAVLDLDYARLVARKRRARRRRGENPDGPDTTHDAPIVSAARARKPIDNADAGETVFHGAGAHMTTRHALIDECLAAVGFQMYTRCSENTVGDWPRHEDMQGAQSDSTFRLRPQARCHAHQWLSSELKSASRGGRTPKFARMPCSSLGARL